METPFRVTSEFVPRGDQPQAIAELVAGLERGERAQTLLGVTGSGKTFTVAKVVEAVQRPTLVIAPNKTLAAQLYSEFKSLFPDNAIEYFVSYYDYYQPEAYVPSTDTYIEKESTINDEIDRMRHSATRSLVMRRDTLIVASVSCIYGIGDVVYYRDMALHLMLEQEIEPEEIMRRLVELQYTRNNYNFERGTFRRFGDVLEVYPAYEDALSIRIEFFGDTIETIVEIDPLTGKRVRALNGITVYPNSHYVVSQERRQQAVETIRTELEIQLSTLRRGERLLEAQRLEQRTMFDLEMLEHMGFCNGIENYSRHLTGRNEGEPPPTLIDYFPDDYLLFIDESHITVPQLGAMYRGDRSRKETLVDFGFRLPSALDNRPLRFEEIEERMRTTIFVSATPGDYELECCEGEIVEQLIRPTGLVDPRVDVRPVANQVDDLLEEIRLRVERKERVLVTTLTKRMAEDLTEYYREVGVNVRYLHSEIDTLERVQILRDLREGAFDVLVGINLLREGLDLPEVSLVAILDADREGFLRSARSLIQTTGRAARNVNGCVIMYADRLTDSMRTAIDETDRRRAVQQAYNVEHGITPQTIVKPIAYLQGWMDKGGETLAKAAEVAAEYKKHPRDAKKEIERLKKEMLKAAENLEFEKAAELRDQIYMLKQLELRFGGVADG
ncbi:MAG: excinuclease ABC subunit UvrB [Myxococcales bacterium]|nr:excinuclease ABC subunit UvrB [Myxococcales bacterium]